MGRGGSSLDALALVLLLCVGECFCEHRESEALILFEYVIKTSMFLYGVVQAGASVVLLTGVSVSLCLSESLQ